MDILKIILFASCLGLDLIASEKDTSENRALHITFGKLQVHRSSSDSLIDSTVFESMDQLSTKNGIKPDASGKYFFQKDEVSQKLRFLLHVGTLNVKYADGQKATIRYNLSKKYVLFLVDNGIKCFEYKN